MPGLKVAINRKQFLDIRDDMFDIHRAVMSKESVGNKRKKLFAYWDSAILQGLNELGLPKTGVRCEHTETKETEGFVLKACDTDAAVEFDQKHIPVPTKEKTVVRRIRNQAHIGQYLRSRLGRVEENVPSFSVPKHAIRQ